MKCRSAARAVNPVAGRVWEKLIFFLVLLVNLIPFAWGALTSFKPVRDVLAYPPRFLGFEASLEHYRSVFANTFLGGVLNSLIYSLCAIALGLVLALMAAYALKRFLFKGRKVLFVVVLSGIPLAIGSAAMVVPNYVFFSYLGLVNKWFTLPVLYTAYNLPMAIWIMVGGMESVPVEIDEAAKVDGASRSYILFRLIPRITLPALASAALFIFLGAWNEFVASSVLVSTPSLYPVQVSIYTYLGYYGVEWGPLTAAATAAVIPTLIVFTILGRLLISGLTAGSVKE